MWSDEQEALRQAVRTLLSRESSPAAVRTAVELPRGYDEKVFSTLCRQIGVSGLAVPEDFGGAGGSLLDACLVLEELGRALTPAPVLGSAVLAAQALLASEDDTACRRLLPGIAEGSSIATLALAGPEGRWDPDAPPCTATADGVLHGNAHYVLDGDHADIVLVAADTPDGVGLFELDLGDGVRRAHTPTMDLTRRLASIELTGAPGYRIGSGDAAPALRRARDLACVALSFEQVGAAARCLELTVEYTKNRVQFGRPIGGFQTLKHRMADAYVLVETARSAAWAAAQAIADEQALAERAAIAKTYCSEAFHQVAAEMIQLHGGIAITWEHDAQLYFKRAHGSAQLFGQPRDFVAELASCVA
ncbi:MAG: acyl-CoA dehydrogenase [Pseudonocardiaceae bacterium]|nr:acyl-CoA dehydrogenase [Pseudonocardiaceae bacterium]